MAKSNGKADVKLEDIQTMQIAIRKGKILTWDDMMQAPKEPEWIIKDLVTAGSVVTIYGTGGSKKTYSVIDMVFSYQMKDNWLGFQIPSSGHVLFVDEESGRNRLSLRYLEAKNGYNVKSKLPIFTICMARYSLRDKDDIETLRAGIKITEAKMVIIDSLVTVLDGDENSSKEIAQLYKALKKIADECGCAIFIIHHSNKIEGYRGSTAIKDQSDLLIKVTSKNGSPNIDFETEKERDIDPTKWSAISHLEKGKKFFLVSSKTNRLSKLGKAQEHVISYISQYGKATMEDLKTNNGDCSSSSIRNATYKLLETNYVSNDEWQGKSRLFVLTELGQAYAQNNIISSLEEYISSL